MEEENMQINDAANDDDNIINTNDDFISLGISEVKTLATQLLQSAENSPEEQRTNTTSEQEASDAAELKKRKRKLATLLLLHVTNFQNTLIANRRRSQQRLRRRQMQLRNFYMKQMIQIQTNYFEMFGILVQKCLQQRKQQQHAKKQLRRKQQQQRPQSSSSKANEAQSGAAAVTSKPPPLTSVEILKTFPLNLETEENWLNHFRMTRRTFTWLCTKLCILKATASAAEPKIPLETRIALPLCMLAHGDYNVQRLSSRFKIHESASVIRLLNQFCSALLTQLGHQLLTLPKDEEDYAVIRANLQRITNMPPAVVGVIGVCSMPMRQRPPTYIRLEALIDDRMLFRKVQIGSSKLTKPLFSEPFNEICDLEQQIINERSIPSFVLAPVHQNYPLRPWLLQRYLDPSAPAEYDFNEAADNLQNLSDKALQRLFTRWQFLARAFQVQKDSAALIITACCALHNLLEDFGEPYLQEWHDAVDVRDFKSAEYEPKPDACATAEDALDLRDFLARTISSTEI